MNTGITSQGHPNDHVALAKSLGFDWIKVPAITPWLCQIIRALAGFSFTD